MNWLQTTKQRIADCLQKLDHCPISLPTIPTMLNGYSTIGTKFKANTLIRTFRELSWFTSMNSIGGDAFYDCTNLETVNTVNITSIGSGSASGEGYSPFHRTKITRLDLPNVTTLGNYIGIRLSAVWVIGTKLASINQYTFRTTSDNPRNSIYLINTVTPASLVSGTSSMANFQGHIYVPDESYDAYIASSAWSPLKSRIKRMSEYTE